jgi:hypothetical protein
VNAEHYLKHLQNTLFQLFQGMGVNMEETFFQQDGARPYSASSVHFLNERFMIGSTLINILNNLEFDGFCNHTLQI